MAGTQEQKSIFDQTSDYIQEQSVKSVYYYSKGAGTNHTFAFKPKALKSTALFELSYYLYSLNSDFRIETEQDQINEAFIRETFERTKALFMLNMLTEANYKRIKVYLNHLAIEQGLGCRITRAAKIKEANKATETDVNRYEFKTENQLSSAEKEQDKDKAVNRRIKKQLFVDSLGDAGAVATGEGMVAGVLGGSYAIMGPAALVNLVLFFGASYRSRRNIQLKQYFYDDEGNHVEPKEKKSSAGGNFLSWMSASSFGILSFYSNFTVAAKIANVSATFSALFVGTLGLLSGGLCAAAFLGYYFCKKKADHVISKNPELAEKLKQYQPELTDDEKDIVKRANRWKTAGKIIAATLFAAALVLMAFTPAGPMAALGLWVLGAGTFIAYKSTVGIKNLFYDAALGLFKGIKHYYQYDPQKDGNRLGFYLRRTLNAVIVNPCLFVANKVKSLYQYDCIKDGGPTWKTWTELSASAKAAFYIARTTEAFIHMTFFVGAGFLASLFTVGSFGMLSTKAAELFHVAMKLPTVAAQVLTNTVVGIGSVLNTIFQVQSVKAACDIVGRIAVASVASPFAILGLAAKAIFQPMKTARQLKSLYKSTFNKKNKTSLLGKACQFLLLGGLTTCMYFNGAGQAGGYDNKISQGLMSKFISFATFGRAGRNITPISGNITGQAASDGANQTAVMELTKNSPAGIAPSEANAAKVRKLETMYQAAVNYKGGKAEKTRRIAYAKENIGPTFYKVLEKNGGKLTQKQVNLYCTANAFSKLNKDTNDANSVTSASSASAEARPNDGADTPTRPAPGLVRAAPELVRDDSNGSLLFSGTPVAVTHDAPVVQVAAS